jgi:hypothetical protein
MIACLAWGSLVWDPRALPLAGPWRSDGPKLPVEFARQSKGGRVTLVLAPHSVAIEVLWAPLALSGLDDAVEALRQREGPTRREWIGAWPALNGTATASTTICAWAQERGLEGVVWTALPPRFDGVDGRNPTQNEVLSYLTSLVGDERNAAMTYVRRAPREIRTPFRIAIEQRLNWTPIEG